MRRKKRYTLVRIALGLAVVAAILPVSAQAKPTPARYEVGPGEIPYLSQGQGVNSSNFGRVLGPDDRNLARTSVVTTPEIVIPYLSQGQGVNSSNFGLVLGSDDRNLARTSVGTTPEVVIPYLSKGEGVTSAELGFAVGNGADDRPFARSNPDTTPVVSDGGRSIDVNPYLMTGSALILLALGMGFALWHTRRTKLSPA